MKIQIINILRELQVENPNDEALSTLIGRVGDIHETKIKRAISTRIVSFCGRFDSCGSVQRVPLTAEETMDEYVNIVIENSSPEEIKYALISITKLNQLTNYKFEAHFNRLHEAFRMMNKQELLDMDSRIRKAVEAARNDTNWQYGYDFAWIKVIIEKERLLPNFDSAQSFVDYLSKTLGISKVPGESTISKKMNVVSGKFPDWTFSDTNDPNETKRRIHIVRRFLSCIRRGE